MYAQRVRIVRGTTFSGQFGNVVGQPRRLVCCFAQPNMHNTWFYVYNVPPGLRAPTQLCSGSRARGRSPHASMLLAGSCTKAIMSLSCQHVQPPRSPVQIPGTSDKRDGPIADHRREGGTSANTKTLDVRGTNDAILDLYRLCRSRALHGVCSVDETPRCGDNLGSPRPGCPGTSSSHRGCWWVIRARGGWFDR